MDELLNKELIDELDIELFFEYVKKARGVSSKSCF